MISHALMQGITSFTIVIECSIVSLEYSPADTVEDLDDDLTVKVAVKKDLQYISGETSAGIYF